MGRCKAWLPWQGRPMLGHVVDVLKNVTPDIVVVGAPDQVLPEVPAQRMNDETEGLGPLAGVAVGLEAVRGPYAFVTATDAPYLTEAFVRAVLAVGGPAAPLVAGRVQVLSAAYPALAAEQARDLLNQGLRRPLDLLEALGFAVLAGDDLPDIRSVEGFNTPFQYLEAVREQQTTGVTVEFLGRLEKKVSVATRVVGSGALRDVLNEASPDWPLTEEGKVCSPYAVSLDGREFLRDGAVPIGPGERLIVLDAAVGG